jgi:NADPH:quinone reductase-like Zn-dependent oxidoreductase
VAAAWITFWSWAVRARCRNPSPPAASAAKSLIGTLTGTKGEVPTGAVMRRQIRLQGLIVGSRTQQQQLVSGMNTTGIRPVIDRRFALADLAAAFRYEESNHHFGKICLEF